jgi:hypothetical protein
MQTLFKQSAIKYTNRDFISVLGQADSALYSCTTDTWLSKLIDSS